MEFLHHKKALITGLASNRSIAYGIAKIFHMLGAELAFTYQNDKLKDRVTNMAAEFNSNLVFPCDLAADNEISQVFAQLSNHWNNLDILIHSAAFAPHDQLNGDFCECVNRDGFRIAHDVSSYSLLGLAKAALPMMQNTAGSILTLSYYGAEKAIPNYNVMGLAKASLEAGVRYLAASLGPLGIRVNAISAGPIRTLAASGIKDLRKMLTAYADVAPLRRNITIEEVGKTAAFLCSDLASGVTAEIIHVDAGFHAVSLHA
ncbi:MAG: enoyl-[acyl-carrier-protein] reductase [Legionellales bacterium RIFCSPHIGHO2_12_FULL_42_9]|nr:MAG: enoyl-[acyl-carrier-protein] reductase [Legionellales bacterium RIFCSPHIGHO2_12_FULL_42_9]